MGTVHCIFENIGIAIGTVGFNLALLQLVCNIREEILDIACSVLPFKIPISQNHQGRPTENESFRELSIVKSEEATAMDAIHTIWQGSGSHFLQKTTLVRLWPWLVSHKFGPCHGINSDALE